VKTPTIPKFTPGQMVPGAVFIVIAVIVFLIGGALSQYHLDTGTRVGVFFIAILSLNLVLGFAGQISLGQGALMLAGAYATAILNAKHGWTIVETLPVAFIVGFGVGTLLGLPAVRLGGVYLALVTFAFAFAMPALPTKYADFFGGGNGLQFGTQSPHWVYNVTWVLAGVLFIGVWLLLRGRTGRAFRAVRDSEIAATSAGVSLPLYKVLAFALSGGIAATAGSMLASVNNSFVSPGAFTVLLSLTILIGAAVGGFGSLYGILIGALFVGLLPDLSKSAPVIGNAHGLSVVYASVVILITFLMPNGFAGLLRTLVLRLTRSQRQAMTTPPAPPASPNSQPPRPPSARPPNAVEPV
jgi:branched-chain amino acid transport system permease protein